MLVSSRNGRPRRIDQTRMSFLLCFGLGYSSDHFLGSYGDGFARIVGTVRSAERAAVLNEKFAGRLRVFAFDGIKPTPEVTSAIGEADMTLISIPQTETGDPVLGAFGGALAQSRRLKSILYLSTVGVYGDHGGGWVDEETPPRPDSERGRKRLAAERAWQDLGARMRAAILGALPRPASVSAGCGSISRTFPGLTSSTAVPFVRPRCAFCSDAAGDFTAAT